MCYRYAEPILKKLGTTGTSVLVRLSAFILLCIGVQIIWNGVHALLRSAFPHAAGGVAGGPAREGVSRPERTHLNRR